MNKSVIEETIIFASVLKWVLFATFIGAIVGFATTGFLIVLAWVTDLSHDYKYFFLLLPVGFVISILLIKYGAPDAEGHGTEKVIEAVHRKSGKISILVVPVKLIATLVTLGVRGSAGKEGPCAQIGAGLASFFADIFKFNDLERKKFVICGISAGFAAVFGTPIAGSLFGVEVLFVGTILYDVLLPSFISGITAYHVSTFLGMKYFHHPLAFIPSFGESFLLKVMGAGVFFGICSLFLIGVLELGRKIFAKITIWTPLKGIIGGLLLIIFTIAFSDKYLGLGLTTIESCLNGETAPWYAFILKSFSTSITLNSGGSGGIVTPIFFVGATSGAMFGEIFGMDIATFSAIGLVCLLAGSANTPIAASVLGIELFGVSIAPYASVACVISYLITGHRSVYPSQVVVVSKSQSIKIESGAEIQNVKVSYQPEEGGFNDLITSKLKKFTDVLW